MVKDPLNIDSEDAEIENMIKDKNHLIVYNKSDLISFYDEGKMYISAKNSDIESLKKEIINKFGLENKNFENPSINNAREIGILESIKQDLNNLILNIDLPIDLLASNIREIINKLLSITGEDCDFDIMKEIFSRFCVGK